MNNITGGIASTIGLRRSRRLQNVTLTSSQERGSEMGGGNKRVCVNNRGNGAIGRPNNQGQSTSGHRVTSGLNTAGSAPILDAIGSWEGPMTRQRLALLGMQRDEIRGQRSLTSDNSSETGSLNAMEGGDGEEVAHRCLFIENVLDNIFKFIVIQPTPQTWTSKLDIRRNVRNIRQVCRAWKDPITRLYRRQCETSAMFLFCKRKNNPRARRNSLGSFMDTMKRSSLIPVQNYTLHGGDYFHPRNWKLFNDFLTICGPDMVNLTFTILENSSNVKKFSPTITPRWDLQKLKTLEINVHGSRNKIRVDQCRGIGTLIGILFNVTKTLQKFALDCFFDFLPSRRESRGVRPLDEFICSELPVSVKILHLNIYLGEGAINNLAERGLTLEKLLFRYRHGMEGRSLFKFLQSQASCLKQLQLPRGCDLIDGTNLLSIPRLKDLTHLDLFDRIVAPFSFGETFPKLQSLKVKGIWNMHDFSEQLSTSQKASQTLKVLHLPFRFSQPLLVRRVAEQFPNIVELSISPSSDAATETLEQVFIHFSSIEVLHISFDRGVNADVILTGVSQEDYERPLNRRLHNGYLEEELVERKPSLLNLTKLRELVLREMFPMNGTLTDFAAQYGFLQMAQLRVLTLIELGQQISPIYIELLKKKLILKLWDYAPMDLSSVLGV